MTEEYGHLPDGFLLNPEEIQELHKQKYQITEYAKDKFRKMNEEAARREKSNRVLARYNDFYNLECSGLPHGTPVTMEQMQMITLQSTIDAIRCEYLNQEYTHIAITDIEDLIEALYQQSISFLERVKEFKDSADGVA
jgi:acyl-CoA thioesterase